MNFKHTLVIFRKELMEVLRDKRTIFTTFILPIILYPLIIVGFNSVMMRQTKVLEERGATIAVQDSVDNEISHRLIQGLVSIKNYTFLPYNDSTKQHYAEKDIQCIVTIRDYLGCEGTQFFKIYITYVKYKDQCRIVYE